MFISHFPHHSMYNKTSLKTTRTIFYADTGAIKVTFNIIKQTWTDQV